MPRRCAIEIQIRDQRDARAGRIRPRRALGLQAEGRHGPTARSSWIRDLVEILDHADSPEELLEHTRMAMYQDRIFAFTPTGELIQLPKGATPVDFAYAVHTDLGDQTVGAKINGRVVPLRTVIENGDQVADPALQGAGAAARLAELRRSPARRAPRSAATSARRSAARRSRWAASSTTRSSQRLPAQLGQEALAQALKRLNLADEDALMEAIARAAGHRRAGDGGADAGRRRGGRRRAAPRRRSARRSRSAG